MEARTLLSPRQVVILQSLVLGLTVKSIARTLRISPSMVRKHINNAKLKLGAKTHDHAIALAVTRGDVSVRMSQVYRHKADTPADTGRNCDETDHSILFDLGCKFCDQCGIPLSSNANF